MKIDRRSFLGLGLGAAAGVAASPVTWKLTDDLSIWTQNWPWTPVPRDGEVTYDDTVCSLCPGNCGISVRKIAGRAVKIEGRSGYPVNDGGVCLHGISALQYLYDPSRVQAPMVRKGDSWKTVTWEEAITLVAEKTKTLRESGKADAVACITDNNRGTISGLCKRFLMAVGSQNFYTMDTMDKSWEMLISKIHGLNASAGFDIANSDYVLSFGTGFIEGWGSPVSNFIANSSRKERHAKLVQVEYRLSSTAAAADQWIPAKPGTEADLALAICSVMINDNLYDKGCVKKFGKEFDVFAKLVTEKYAPELVTRTTGIDASKIRSIAADFAKAKAPLAIAGRGKGDSAGSLMEFAAVHALNCLSGNINKKGGFWTIAKDEPLTWPSLEMDDVATKGYAKATIGENSSVSKLFEAVNSSENGSPVEMLMVCNANPCYNLHNAKGVQEAVKKIPFVVNISSYMDDTANLADVILPAHMFLEMSQDLYTSSGTTQRVTSLSKPIASPIFDTKHPGEAVIMIAKALEGSIASSFPWETYDECLESVTGEMWSTLSEEGFIDSGSQASEVSAMDFSLFASFKGFTMPEGDKKNYPLTLVQVDHMRLASGTFASSPFAVKTVSDSILKDSDSLVEINPETADQVGVSDGDIAFIETPVGKARVKVNLFDGIMPGVIAMTEGLGHFAGDNHYIGGKGVNVNELIGPVTDPDSGLDAAWGIRARLSRA
ncbi:Molybdopterin oxidoreductase, molybdopterin-binding subunit [Desulfamplus magnetovallimortis]|uniref:Molybdopterin oxidoreductase, molybdopterin-binding subunit n=1 Tax=Desulfamplus magnetovallimortis TaxID=1246637 RepID=A0A1W1H9R1_9BACT|nr:menaquinone reductase molybdopterin-binding-like subunit QrcB [Desulfamplus magnetovallimortis]SLM29169.1 Molybdopterin oxidoreductase, molybdopterin-binding subunit [Desulfamplus magnetovallimortis]